MQGAQGVAQFMPAMAAKMPARRLPGHYENRGRLCVGEHLESAVFNVQRPRLTIFRSTNSSASKAVADRANNFCASYAIFQADYWMPKLVQAKFSTKYAIEQHGSVSQFTFHVLRLIFARTNKYLSLRDNVACASALFR